MNADIVIQKMNAEMYKKKSEVRFTWSSTENNNTDPENYFLLWGYKKSAMTYGNPTPITSVFLFKGKGTMLDDLIQREGELEKFEKYVSDSIPSIASEEKQKLEVSI